MRKKQSNFIKVHHTRVVQTGKDCGETSPYHQWIQEHGYDDYETGKEPSQGNPDTLTDLDTFYTSSEPLFSVGEISSILSGQQKKIFDMYVNENLDEHEISAILKIKYSTVRTHLQRVRKRFLKRCKQNE